MKLGERMGEGRNAFCTEKESGGQGKEAEEGRLEGFLLLCCTTSSNSVGGLGNALTEVDGALTAAASCRTLKASGVMIPLFRNYV